MASILNVLAGLLRHKDSKDLGSRTFWIDFGYVVAKGFSVISSSSRIKVLLFSIILCLTFIGCSEKGTTRQSESPEGGNESTVKFVLKVAPGPSYLPDTIPFGFGEPLKGLKEVAAAFEKRFPDTKIEFINVPGVREYLVTQLSSGRAPDILNVNVEDVWTDVQKGWYVPLDRFLEQPNPFVAERNPDEPGAKQWWDMFQYQAISRGKAAPDGLMYCLSLDMVETGFFYNKTLFEKLNLGIPQDWDELDALCEKIREAGLTPVLMNLDTFSDWCTDLFFDQLYYPLLPGIDLLQDPLREPYLQGYLDADEILYLFYKGFFTHLDPRFREMWRIMKEFRRHANRNLVIDPMQEFVSQRAVMFWNSSAMTFRLVADKNLGFEWGVFYPPKFTPNTSKYASGEEMCVIGGAATQLEVTNSAYSDTGNPETSERLRRVIAFLQFLCLPENCEKVVNEYPCFIPNIRNVPVLEPLKPFDEILKRRYTTTKWIFTFDLRYAEIQRRMLDLYLNDGISLDDYIRWQEDNLAAACENHMKRKRVDLERLEKAWEARKPFRASMTDLPPDAQ